MNKVDKYLTEMMSVNFEQPVRIVRIETIEVVDEDGELLALIEPTANEYQVRINGNFSHTIPKIN